MHGEQLSKTFGFAAERGRFIYFPNYNSSNFNRVTQFIVYL